MPGNDTASGTTAISTELMTRLAREMQQDQGVAYKPLPIRVKLKGDRWSALQRGVDEPFMKLEVLEHVLIIDARIFRAAYGDRNQKIPSCASRDAGVHGTLDPQLGHNLPVPIPNGQLCATCELNKFNTGVDQNGAPTRSKFCGERRNLLAIVPEIGDHPLVISVPTMSCTVWDAYADGLNRNKALKKVGLNSFRTQLTRIEIRSQTRTSAPDQEYGVAVFSSEGMASESQIALALELKGTYAELMGHIDDTNPAAEETTSPASEEEFNSQEPISFD